MKRAGFIGHHLWVTPFDQNQRFPAGPYVNQPWVATGFTLQPAGFFDRNPALDVPPASSRASREAACSGCEA